MCTDVSDKMSVPLRDTHIVSLEHLTLQSSSFVRRVIYLTSLNASTLRVQNQDDLTLVSHILVKVGVRKMGWDHLLGQLCVPFPPSKM